ncbi:MAG: type II toxin-antitoxin system RelE/ParE family toxin [Patescibacteria group bacterium]
MEVALSEKAKRDYKRLPKFAISKIEKKLEFISQNPYSGKKLGGELGNFWSLRVWPYRIIYEINKKKKLVEIHKIIHRQSAYN